MKIIVTGSLGYIGKPLTKELVRKGHSVTVISSNAKRQKEIEALGAKAAIGGMENVDFLTKTFTDADVVYCMIALEGNFTDPGNNAGKLITQAEKFANNYSHAIEKSGQVKNLVTYEGI